MLDNNAKEAAGLKVIRHVIESDPRLVFQKCDEGSRADFVVYTPASPETALGVQLKTCHKASPKSTLQFAHTDGYGGLLMLLLDMSNSCPRAWVIPGSLVLGKSVVIPCVPMGPCKRDWSDYAVELDHLSQKLFDIQTAPGDHIRLASAESLTIATSLSQQAERRAYIALRAEFPLPLVEPEVEHRQFDCTVQGVRWQLKRASYVARRDCFQLNLHRHAPNVQGVRSLQNYMPDDFDILGIQLPPHPVLPPQSLIYLIPMRALMDNGYIGAMKSCTFTVYPHRQINGRGCNKLVQGEHWTQRYLIDLSSPTQVLDAYNKIIIGAV